MPMMPANSTHIMGPPTTAAISGGFMAMSMATMPVKATPSAM